jgi:hypothetical protein
MSEIIKTKFLCKTGSRTAPRAPLGSIKWEDRFIEGKWYDGEYETWSLQLFKLNNGWRRYWVINEKGQKEEISKAQIRAIFEFDIQQLREEKIKEILKKDNE